MNRSLVITRYARALVKYVRETGDGEVVASEAKALANALSKVPELQRMMEAAGDVISNFDKKKLLQSALGNRLSPELSRFISLVLRNGRSDLLQEILRDFVDQYHRSVGIRKAHLVTAYDPSERLMQRLKALVREKTGDDVIIEVEVDPTILGGFIFEIDEYMLDASVKRQLDDIREQFIERNRRIV